jgi:xanthine dehydrogenase accessory factor
MTMSAVKKVYPLFKNLQAEGITEEAIGRVHSPSGLNIGAQTPEEIAVGIMAEMIAVRSRERLAPGSISPTKKGLS